MKLIVFIIIFIIATTVTLNSTNLYLPKCNNNKLLTTPITFFISSDVLEIQTKLAITDNIDSWIVYANQTLSNSCIPIKREVSEILYIKELTEELFQDIHVAHVFLEYYVGYEKISRLKENKAHYYGIIFKSYQSSFNAQWCGKTDVDTLPDFFILAADCTVDILEHELGHLAWAKHDKENYSPSYMSNYALNRIFPYAFGFECAGKGTIMSYEKEVLPIYSSPNIFYYGERCGDSRYANNARVLRDFALKTLISEK